MANASIASCISLLHRCPAIPACNSTPLGQRNCSISTKTGSRITRPLAKHRLPQSRLLQSFVLSASRRLGSAMKSQSRDLAWSDRNVEALGPEIAPSHRVVLASQAPVHLQRSTTYIPLSVMGHTVAVRLPSRPETRCKFRQSRKAAEWATRLRRRTASRHLDDLKANGCCRGQSSWRSLVSRCAGERVDLNVSSTRKSRRQL